MAVNVNQIAKETLVELTKRNLHLTPENYAEVFEEVAKKYGRVTQSSDKLQNYISKLNPSLAKDVKSRNVRNIEELLMFLIARSNNFKDEGDDKKLVSAYNVLCKRLLQNLSSIPYKNAKEFGNSSLNKLNQGSLKSIEEINESLLEVEKDINILNSELTNKFQSLGVENQGDILNVLNELGQKNAGNSNEICVNLAPSVAYSLTPSIADYLNEEMNLFCKSINDNPSILGEKNIAEQFKDLIKKRIDMDRAEISSSNKVLNEVLEQISSKIINILSTATNSHEKVKEIKKEIEGIQSSDKSMILIKNKLLTIVSSFEEEVQSLKDKTKQEASILNELKGRVQGLEQEVNKLREESQVDFLTQLANKRQLEDQLRLAEESFNRYGINYSIAFFDIDHFKSINDTYGHTAGDTILANIGSLILSQIRKLDCAGRYGGEEFMVILPHASVQDAYKFAEKIRILVSEQKFLCKGQTISVKVSGGVSDRSKYTNQEEFVEEVDKLLYAAKNAGRNNIQSAK